MYRDTFHVVVPIKESLKKCLVFRLHARLPIGIILGFVGFRHEVLCLMQAISHSTRAFVWNADGLQGFIDRFDIIKLLKRADRDGTLAQVTEW